MFGATEHSNDVLDSVRKALRAQGGWALNSASCRYRRLNGSRASSGPQPLFSPISHRLTCPYLSPQVCHTAFRTGSIQYARQSPLISQTNARSLIADNRAGYQRGDVSAPRSQVRSVPQCKSVTCGLGDDSSISRPSVGTSAAMWRLAGTA